MFLEINTLIISFAVNLFLTTSPEALESGNGSFMVHGPSLWKSARSNSWQTVCTWLLWEQSLSIWTLVAEDIALLNYTGFPYILSQVTYRTYSEPQKNGACQARCVTAGLGKDVGHFLMKTAECSPWKQTSPGHKDVPLSHITLEVMQWFIIHPQGLARFDAGI